LAILLRHLSVFYSDPLQEYSPFSTAVSADGGEEGKKKDNRAAVASDRIGTAISPMEIEQIQCDMSFSTKPLIG